MVYVPHMHLLTRASGRTAATITLLMFFGISASQKPAQARQEAAVVDVEHHYRVLERSVYPRSIVVGHKLVPDELVRDPDRGRTFRSHLDVLVEDSTAADAFVASGCMPRTWMLSPRRVKLVCFLGFCGAWQISALAD